ncbi:MAG TPA: hypothetical protein VKA70_09920 [Blastocatellia bacterium]|nr:hypothetical protein [Blastocatellia bacterium]
MLKRFAPESFDVIARLASPVLPSGKQVGKVLGAVALAVLGGSVLASYYLLDSGFWGFLFAIPVLMLISALLHAPSYWGEWQILRQAAASQTPRDNTRVALHGHIYPESGEPILSPLSASPCIAYAYEITRTYTHHESDPAKRRTEVKVEFEGIGLTPSFIETKQGRVRLLAWPNFMSRSLDFDTKRNVDAKRAADYFRSSLIVETDEQALAKGGGESFKAETGGLQLDTKVGEQSRQELIGFFADQTSIYSGGDRWQVKERLLPAGAEVCVIGLYSAERQAIVSDYESSKKQLKLYEGHPSFVELYHRRFFRIIPVLVTVILALVGIFVLTRET